MELSTGTPYEYSRSRSGLVFTAGACPLDASGNVVAPGDLVGQAEQATDNLLAALAEAGATADSLLMTTIYVVASERADLVRVWGRRLGASCPRAEHAPRRLVPRLPRATRRNRGCCGHPHLIVEGGG
jgi:enamine deaminase RidA (YjgF/YER057c/UK114 family)